MKQTGLAIIGFGIAGGGTIRQIQAERTLLRERFGIDLAIRHVVVRDPGKPRPFTLAEGSLGSDWRLALADPAVDIVVELIGGSGTAREVVETALRQGKHVVTANKALLAEHGGALFALARERGLCLAWEAAVCAGIPLVRALADGLAADRITGLSGILNGTSIFILTRMSEDGIDFGAALGLARQAGLAEADPSLDVDGHDAAHKLALLAGLAFGAAVDHREIPRRGIRDLSPLDFAQAARLGFGIRPLARASLGPDGRLACAVGPVLLPDRHPLRAVRDEYNAVLAESRWLGRSVHVAKGAGESATANSIVADLVEIARRGPDAGQCLRWPPVPAAVLPPGPAAPARHYVRVRAGDGKPDLASLTAALGGQQVSIAGLSQLDRDCLVLLTHPCPGPALENTLASLAAASPGSSLIALPIAD